MIPDRRVELVRVSLGDQAGIVEAVVIGASSGDEGVMGSPSCLWWRFDDQGRVARETAYWEWAKRRPWAEDQRGTVL